MQSFKISPCCHCMDQLWVVTNLILSLLTKHLQSHKSSFILIGPSRVVANTLTSPRCNQVRSSGSAMVVLFVCCSSSIREFFTHFEISASFRWGGTNFHLCMVLKALAVRALYHASTYHNIGPQFLRSYPKHWSLPLLKVGCLAKEQLPGFDTNACPVARLRLVNFALNNQNISYE